MENTILIALSRQDALRRQMDLVAHNISNINTTGFKGQKMMFVDHLVRSRGGDSILGDKHAYVRDVATYRDVSEGELRETGNPLDVAVRNDGFFVVETDQGPRYTRAGRFHLDGDGQLLSEHGYSVLSDAGQPFTFSPEDKAITIARDGTVSTENGILGRMRIVSFENPQNLRDTTSGLYESDDEPVDVDQPDVVQCVLEGSNVEGVSEITEMIRIHRAHDGVKGFIDKEDERLKRMTRELLAA